MQVPNSAPLIVDGVNGSHNGKPNGALSSPNPGSVGTGCVCNANSSMILMYVCMYVCNDLNDI